MSSGFSGNGNGWNGRPRRENGRLTAANDAIFSGLASNDLTNALRPHMAKAIWARTVGPQVAAVTQPVSIRNGNILVVRVKNSVWANEITLLKDDILRRLNKALGGPVLADLYVDAGGLRPVEAKPEEAVIPAPKEKDVDAVAVSDTKVLEIEVKIKGIKDPQRRRKLREDLMKMAQVDAWKRENGWKDCVQCGTLAYPRPEKPGEHLCDICRIRKSRQL